MRTTLLLVLALSWPLRLSAQGTPAGAPAGGHSHAHGAHAATRVAGEMDSATHAALARQIAAVREVTARYHDIEAARSDGYALFAGGEAPLMGEHWYRRDIVKDSLDLALPSTLQYATIGGERRLVGVAYTVYQRPDEEPPEGFAGPEDHWHVHDIPMLARVISEGRPVLRWLVNRRIENDGIGAGEGRTQLVMVHAWIWLDNPDGMFALRHRALPYLQAGLPAEWAAMPGADEDAARGLMLLASSTCTREVRLADRLADLSRAQERTLREGCASAADAMHAARDAVGGEPPGADDHATSHALNAAAAAAWREWIAVRDQTLTDEQLARLRRITEHAETPS